MTAPRTAAAKTSTGFPLPTVVSAYKMVEISTGCLIPIAANSAPRKNNSSARPLTDQDHRDQGQIAEAGVPEYVLGQAGRGGRGSVADHEPAGDEDHGQHGPDQDRGEDGPGL